MIHCNARLIYLDSVADFGDYPTPMWYHPDGIANIMLLHNITRHYRVTMDSTTDNALVVHLGQGEAMAFMPTDKGLYRHVVTLEKRTQEWTMVHTVKSRAEGHTSREVTLALAARKLQNIMMFPATHELMDKGIKHLMNCPVTKGDINAAESIFGPNIGSLKGKMVRKNMSFPLLQPDNILPEIWDKCQSVPLATDIFFVNKMGFLITMSCGIQFVTVEHLTNRKATHVANWLAAMIRLYKHQGCKVTTIHANPEFKALKDQLPMVETSGADDHILDIERMIRTTKDRVRSAYNTLPYSRVLRMMVIHLVHNAVFWIKSMPATHGISQEHSPGYIMMGQTVNYNKHAQLEFRQYVQTHEKHSNRMEQWMVGAINLGPTSNQQGSH